MTLRTEESARLRYLKDAEVMGVLSQGTHVYKEVLVAEDSPSEITNTDWQRKMISKRSGNHRESSSSGQHRQHQRGV